MTRREFDSYQFWQDAWMRVSIGFGCLLMLSLLGFAFSLTNHDAHEVIVMEMISFDLAALAVWSVVMRWAIGSFMRPGRLDRKVKVQRRPLIHVIDDLKRTRLRSA